MKEYLTFVLSQSGSRVRKVLYSDTCYFSKQRQGDPEPGWQSQETRKRQINVFVLGKVPLGRPGRLPCKWF